MEFIPLEKNGKKGRKKEAVKTETKPKKIKKNETVEEEPLKKKGKHKAQPKIIEKKQIKNKRKEKVTKRKVLEKAVKKKKKMMKEEEEEEEDQDTDEEDQEEMDESKTEENNEEDESNEDSEDEEAAFRRKCQEMDEKKKNRLFIKLKKKILNEAQIKELHPDIRSVIFPRKKKSRWCWAVFASKEKANAAMKNLIKNKDITVNKPTPYEKVDLKRKEKMKTVLRKKQARKKLKEMWM